jgi:glycosyltransferase involved in cell wall biosynthesis
MKVCIIPAGEGGVAFYRVIQPYSYLRDVMCKDIFIYDKKVHDMSRLYHEIESCDIMIHQMPCSEQINTSIRNLRKRFPNKKMVAEYDDNIFGAVSPWNTKYNVFGIDNVSVTYSRPEDIEMLKKYTRPEWVKDNKNGSYTFKMWENGFNDFFIENNIARLSAAKETVEIADLVTTTTQELAKELRAFRPKGKIAVLPNLVDFDRFLPMKKLNDGKVRIVWQGGSAHFADIAMIGPELVSFAKKHPEVEYVFQGVEYSAIFKEIKDRVKWLAWHGDIYTYPLSVRDLAGDIAICPLVDDKFNRSKSPLKYEEMSAMNVPCVCSPTVYGKYIEHGKDGFIAKQGEWEQCLEELLDEKKRNLVSERAYNRVKSRFGIQNATMYWSALQDMYFGTDTSLNKQDIVKYKPIVVPEFETELCTN